VPGLLPRPVRPRRHVLPRRAGGAPLSVAPARIPCPARRGRPRRLPDRHGDPLADPPVGAGSRDLVVRHDANPARRLRGPRARPAAPRVPGQSRGVPRSPLTGPGFPAPVPFPPPLVPARELRALVRSDAPRLRIVDCRWVLGKLGEGLAAYAAGHIPGAVP